MTRAVFLDRDGVIVRHIMRDEKLCAPRRISEFEFLPNSKLACYNLTNAGYMLFVVTNQPDIGNGYIRQAAITEMHERLLKELPITQVYCCPHSQGKNCDCRKPKPGMLIKAMEEYGIDMAQSWMIGDRRTDIEAGRAVGCQTIIIADDVKSAVSTYTYADYAALNFLTASKVIIGEKHHEH